MKGWHRRPLALGEMEPVKAVTTHGVKIPALGFGTFGLDDDVARHLVGYALEIGYRHIDTARDYGNETAVGDAIRVSSVPRHMIWLTTKVSTDRLQDGDLQRSVEESVGRLRTEPDLLLIHWPSSKVPLHETIGAMNEVKRRGLTNHIGVSNFTVQLIRQPLSRTEEPLILNPVEYHPYLSQWTVLESLRANGIAMTAYSPLAQGRVFRNEMLKSIGECNGKTAGQVALRWLLQQDGVIAIPGSSREANIKANLDIGGFTLTIPELERISARANPHGRTADPLRNSPAWDDLGPIGRVRGNARKVRRNAGRIFRIGGRIRRLYRSPAKPDLPQRDIRND